MTEGNKNINALISKIARELILEGHKVEIAEKNGVYTVGIAIEEEATSEWAEKFISGCDVAEDGLSDYTKVHVMTAGLGRVRPPKEEVANESTTPLEEFDYPKHIKKLSEEIKAVMEHLHGKKEVKKDEYISVKEIVQEKSGIAVVTNEDLEVMKAMSADDGYEVLNVSCFIEKFETEEMKFHESIWLRRLSQECSLQSTIAYFKSYIKARKLHR